MYTYFISLIQCCRSPKLNKYDDDGNINYQKKCDSSGVWLEDENDDTDELFPSNFSNFKF